MNKYPGIETVHGKHGRSYKVRYRNSVGGQTSRTFRKLTEARAFKNEIDIARRNGSVGAKRADQVTFSELAAEWVSSRHHRPTTARRRDGILNKHLLPALGATTLNRIRHTHLQDLVGQWTASGLAPNTVRQHVQILHSIFERAVNDDILNKNPTAGLTLPRTGHKKVRALTPAEATALKEATEADYAPIVEILLATGCRWSELEDMNVEDFSPKEGTVHVRRSKTAAGERTIELDAKQTTIITKHLLATGRGGEVGGPLFTSPDGKRLNYSNFRTRVFQPAVERAGLRDVTIHSLRRTHATALVAAGYSMKAVQQRMGHASISTTLTFYTMATEPELRETASAMSRYLAQATEAHDTAEETA